jgi:hypothetical protein
MCYLPKANNSPVLTPRGYNTSINVLGLYIMRSFAMAIMIYKNKQVINYTV